MAGPPDPDAALHAAEPGKYKPASAEPPPQPAANDTGTLSDSVERYPNETLRAVYPTQAPVEAPQSWGDWLGSGWDHASSTFHAAEDVGRNDRADFQRIALRDGYAPILDALDLPAGESPWMFGDGTYNIVDPRGASLNETGLLYRRHNPDASYWQYSNVSRQTQEQLIVDEIRARRAKDPHFLAGVPDTVNGLHDYFIENEKKRRAAAQATLAGAPKGLGTSLSNLSGSLVEAMHDPVNIATMPIGGGGKTVLGVFAREALVNGVIEAAEQPLVAKNRAVVGEHLTAGEAATNIATAGAGAGTLGVLFHVGGKALNATGLPQKLGAVVGNLDLANTLSYKIYSAMPDALQRKWGAGIVTKWAHRLANGEKLEDVFSNLSNVELATLSTHVIGAERMTPEERTAAEHLTRTQEVGDSSPYEAGATGDGTHESKLADALNEIIYNRPAAESPSASPRVDPDAGVATAPATARPPAATSTAGRRPLSPASAPARLPAEIYDGLTKRGIPDHIARGVAAGSFAESRGRINALGPVTAATHGEQAFGIGQWLGSRKAELFRRYGPSPTLDQQLDHLVWELKGGDAGGKSVLAAKDEVDALHHYITDFMRPGAGTETTKDLGRGMAALGRSGEVVSAEGDAGGAIDVPDDPDIARLREDALKLDDAVIGAPASDVPPMYARSVRPDDLTVDASRFQFKAGGDELGVTDRLRGVKEWNPMYAGRVVAWEDKAGGLFLADGHQRLGLARRLEGEGHAPIGVDALVLREADGVSAEDARVYGALKNIAEGTGSMVDAAKVIRGAGDHLLAHLPPKSALVRDARALASLSDEAFGAVYNDVLPADYAAVIGHLLPDRPEAHGAMVDLLVKTDPANRGQAESIVRQGIAAGMHSAEQVDLFGSREVMQSLMLERAKVLEKGLAQLRKSKLLFKTAAKEADRLEAVGSKIAKSASEKEAQANAQALELVSRLAFTHGPIADALNDASRRLAAGAKLADVADEFAAAVKRTDLGTLAREAANDDANRLVPDGAGRGGDAAEAGTALRSQQDEQPSLTDLERATERFSNPDGPATKQQADSRFHDLKADVERNDAIATRREKIKAATAALEGGKPGELRTVEPFAEEPGYHRFRYVAEDGTAIGGNYTIDGNLVEGFNIGDTHSRVELGPKELRNLFAQLHAEHPEVQYVHGYRMSGARAKEGGGEQEMWLALTDKGVKRLDGPPAPEAVGAEKLDLGAKTDPAIADRQRQEVALHAASPLRPGAVDAEGVGGLGLFDHHDQLAIELHDEARALLEELDADDKAIKALKDCL